MHVGLVIYGHLDRQSGGYLYDRKVVEHLREQGHRVTVFSQPDRPYHLHWIDNFDVSFWSRVAASDVDVLLQDELNHASLFLGNRWLRTQIDAPIVSIVHHLRSSEQHPEPARTMYECIERAYLATADAFVFNSPTTRTVVERMNGPQPHVIARPSGRRFGPPLDEATIRRRAHQDGPLRLVFVGNVIPRKQLDVLLVGLRRSRADWSLDVAGSLATDPSYARDVRTLIDSLDDPGRVTIHGSVSDAELLSLMQDSHVLAVPSSYEGYGIVYVEAMGQGLPVLATPNGGPVDVVRHETDGLLLQEPLPDSIAAAVDDLAENRSALAVMGAAAREVYMQSPTWHSTAVKVNDFLLDIV